MIVMVWLTVQMILLEVGIMEKHFEIPDERFGKNSLIALATVDENGIPWV